jgi:hypothetical protein
MPVTSMRELTDTELNAVCGGHGVHVSVPILSGNRQSIKQTQVNVAGFTLVQSNIAVASNFNGFVI